MPPPSLAEFFVKLQRYCTNDTRIIIEYYSYLWQMIVDVGEKLHISMPRRLQNWLTDCDIINFLELTGYEAIKLERKIICPLWIPAVSFILNRIVANLPIINLFALDHFLISRPLMARTEECSTSIVIPCRNEKDNVEQAIQRMPSFSKLIPNH